MIWIHKIIVLLLSIMAITGLIALGDWIGSNTLRGHMPSWVCYIGTGLCILGYGFFNGVFIK